jgi:hypothetical protein
MMSESANRQIQPGISHHFLIKENRNKLDIIKIGRASDVVLSCFLAIFEKIRYKLLYNYISTLIFALPY